MAALLRRAVQRRRRRPQIEIADTLGLVQSQAVESRDRALRITLNGSMGAQTLSSRFLQHYMGAGVQHIAFVTGGHIRGGRGRTRERPAECSKFRTTTTKTWKRSSAWHRTWSSDWRGTHILYDRDGAAEYFQFYSRAFAKRVFFEIVERRGYEAYGAGNASIRLAAQARFKGPTPRLCAAIPREWRHSVELRK